MSDKIYWRNGRILIKRIRDTDRTSEMQAASSARTAKWMTGIKLILHLPLSLHAIKSLPEKDTIMMFSPVLVNVGGFKVNAVDRGSSITIGRISKSIIFYPIRSTTDSVKKMVIWRRFISPSVLSLIRISLIRTPEKQALYNKKAIRMHSDGFYVIFNCISILLRWLEPQSSPFLLQIPIRKFFPLSLIQARYLDQTSPLLEWRNFQLFYMEEIRALSFWRTFYYQRKSLVYS